MKISFDVGSKGRTAQSREKSGFGSGDDAKSPDRHLEVVASLADHRIDQGRRIDSGTAPGGVLDEYLKGRRGSGFDWIAATRYDQLVTQFDRIGIASGQHPFSGRIR